MREGGRGTPQHVVTHRQRFDVPRVGGGHGRCGRGRDRPDLPAIPTLLPGRGERRRDGGDRRSNGVRVVDIEALFAVLEADPSGRTAAHAERLLALAEVFGAQSIGTHSNFDGNLEVAAERLRRFCDIAAGRGLWVGVEPVPVMTLSDLATAWDVMECSGAANVGLVLDTWHFSRGAGTLAMVRSLPARAFRTVQISDGALVGPPDLDYLEDTLSNRLPPGEGELDLTGIVQALVDIGADVAWDMEICSSVLDALSPPEAALPRHPGDPSGPGQGGMAVDRSADVKHDGVALRSGVVHEGRSTSRVRPEQEARGDPLTRRCGTIGMRCEEAIG